MGNFFKKIESKPNKVIRVFIFNNAFKNSDEVQVITVSHGRKIKCW